MSAREPSQLARFRHEVSVSPTLVERVLTGPPPGEGALSPVVIRCDSASVDAAIARGLALAMVGVEARIELLEDPCPAS